MKSKIIQLILVVLLATYVKAQPPNNAIFFGGSADGSGLLKNTDGTFTFLVIIIFFHHVQ